MACSVCAGYSSYNCPVCGDKPRTAICPDCNGSGEGGWMIFDIHERVEVRCTAADYHAAPENEDDAFLRGVRHCKLSCTCPTCQGDGEISND